MPDSFYTKPADISIGLQMLEKGLTSRAERKLEEVKERKNLAMRDEAAKVVQRNNPEEISMFIAKNPGAKEVFQDMLGTERDAMLDASRRWLINQEDPFEVHTAEAEKAIAEGRDPSGNIEMARAVMSTKDREQARKMHETVLAMLDPRAYQLYKGVQPGMDGDVKVKSSKILEDGTLIQSTDKGSRVFGPDGRRLTGKAAADAITQARAKEIEQERKKAGEKKTATLEAEKELKAEVEAGVVSRREAAKISVDAYKKLEPINASIRLYDEAINLLEKEGATTGVVAKWLPSFRQSSIRLDNLQKRMGLNVLQNTTFGSLSASELRFALESTMPKGLQPKDLAQWMREKKAAQEKLADYIEAAAIYLDKHTISEYLQKKRNERAAEEVPEQQEQNNDPLGIR